MTKSTRTLTEKQQLFLDALFSNECGGDPVKAKRAAGYSDNFPTKELLKSLQDEIVDAARDHLHHLAAKAAMSMGEVLMTPEKLGNREKLAAAKELLDRVGIVKTEKVDVNIGGGVILLPAKDEE